jgi:hypothetical protein
MSQSDGQRSTAKFLRGLTIGALIGAIVTAGIFARSGGRLAGSNVSTCNAIKLNSGTPSRVCPF